MFYNFLIKVNGAKYISPENSEFVLSIDTAMAMAAVKTGVLTIKGKDGKTDSEAKRQVSRLLGHEREDVTRIYLATVREDGYGGKTKNH